MEIYCTRPECPRPLNSFIDLDDKNLLKTVQQKYCTTCGMPLILIGRYLPVKLLGRGGFGAAFLARDRYTPAMRKCVVKMFQPAGDLTAHQMQIAQQLFEREATVLEELGNQHPQIPDLFAFFPVEVNSLQGGNPDLFFYLAQEFIDGKNLEEELEQKGQFSEDEVLEVLREILKVLKFVHDRHIIHRDIKPSNIMRDAKGTLYLLDFGAVKQITQGAIAGAAGRSTGIYSMGFAPPEQMAGSTVFPATDLYALAVTCITLLTGKQPTDLFDSYSNQWNWSSYAKVSDELAEVLDRMLQFTPSQRFQSAEEVLAAIAPKHSQPASFVNPPPLPNPIPTTPHPPPAVLTPTVTSPPPPPVVQSSRGRFSTLELLAGAAFTGFEGGLLFIALSSLLISPGLTIGLWVLIIGGLIFAQSKRAIEGKDLSILAGLTLAIVWFAPVDWQFSKEYILLIAILAAAGAIALTALFRLIYKLLSSLF